MTAPVQAVVITVSDRCAAGEREDRSGPLARDLLQAGPVVVRELLVVPDDVEQIRQAIRVGAENADLVFTTGGTGVGPYDLTPEATAALLACEIPGLADAIRAHGQQQVPAALLSRGLAGLTSREPDAALVVNAPGSPGGVRDAVAALLPVLSHLLDQRRGGDH